MTDFYQWLTGRPAPGMAARDTPVSRYLNDPSDRPEVARAGGASRSAREGNLPSVPRYAQDAAEASAPRLRQRLNSPPPPPEMVIGPGGITETPPPEPMLAHTPFSAAAGVDDRPYGDDFAAWYEATRGRPLPSALRDDYAPPEEVDNPGHIPNNPNNIPLGVEGGTTVEATRLETSATDHAPTRRITLPAITDTYDERTGRGIRPDFNPTQAWIEAERRAYDRAREGRPSAADTFMAAVFGQRRRKAD